MTKDLTYTGRLETVSKALSEVLEEALPDTLILDQPPATRLVCECGKDYVHIHLVRQQSEEDQ